MGKAVRTVGTILVVGGLALATAGAALIPAAAGGGLAGAFGTAIGGVTASQLIAAGSALRALGAQPAIGRSGSPVDWKADPNAPLTFAYGRIMSPGHIVYRKGFGPENMYQGIISVLSAGGPIDSVESFLVEHQAVTFDANHEAVGTYADKLWASWRLGAQPDTALASPPNLRSSSTLPGWTSDHKLSGKACTMVTLGHDSKGKVWKRGEPQTGVVFKGLKVWDPRADSTWPGGSGSQRRDDPSTWVWSANPGLVALDWVLGRYENGVLVGGYGQSLDEVRVDTFLEVANVCDALSLTLGGIVSTDDDKYQVLAAMLQAGGAAPITIDGKTAAMVRVASKTSLLTLAREDIVGEISVQVSPSRRQRVNTVRPRYRSEAHRWEMVTADEVSRAEYLAEDGGQLRPKQVEYPLVAGNVIDQVALLASYDLADSREGLIGAIPSRIWLRELEPGHAFTMPVDDDLGSLSGKKLLVLSRETDTAGGVVALGVREETDEKHTWAGGVTTTVPDPTDYDPPPTTFPAPDAGDWTLSAGTGGLPGLVLTGEVTNPLADMVRVEWRPDGGTDWFHFGNYSAEVERVEITLPGAATAYEVAVAYRSEQTGIWGDRLVLGPETTGGVVVEWPDVVDTGDGTYPGGDLARLDQVNTAEIVENAVTERASAFTSGTINLGGSTHTTIQELVVEAAGETLDFLLNYYLVAENSSSFTVFLNIDREPYPYLGSGRTTIYTQQIYSPIAGADFVGPYPFFFDDTPLAGDYTYRATIAFSRDDMSTETAESRFLRVLNAKR